MGEARELLFEPSFNRSIKARSRDDRLTSDAGVLILREIDHRLGLTSSLAERLCDPRDQRKIRYTATELLRERVYSLALGYAAADDCDALAHDPAFRLATWDRRGARVADERLASQPTQSRLLGVVSRDGNRHELLAAVGDWCARHQRADGRGRKLNRATIDVDGFPIEVHGRQEGGVYNGYYHRTVYSPLVASFAPGGDYDRRLGDGFVGVKLRAGNAAPAEGGLEFIRAAYASCRERARSLDVRFDAGFTCGEILDGLTDDGIRFVGRIRSNSRLQAMAQPFLKRPVGRPPDGGYEFTVELGTYKAETWRHAQRVVLCVVDKPDPDTGQLDLFPRAFFLVTSWDPRQRSADDLLAGYRRRGTFEDRLGELESAIRPRLSSPSLEENEATLALSLLAFNLLNIVRGEMESIAPSGWDLARVQKSVLKAGARVLTSARRLLVDVAAPAAVLWRLLCAGIAKWFLTDVNASSDASSTRRPWIDPPLHAQRSLILRI